MDKLTIFCADIGSVKNGKFGWAQRKIGGHLVLGKDIGEFASEIAKSIQSNLKVSIGFEAPMFVPVRDNASTISNARVGDGNRAWSAGAGTGALATGIVETLWLLRKVKAILGFAPEAHFDWAEFENGSGVHFWEAFVTAKAKGVDHSDDAAIAIKNFEKSLPNLEAHNAIYESSVLSLLGASILRSGWSADVNWLYKPCLVIKAE